MCSALAAVQIMYMARVDLLLIFTTFFAALFLTSCHALAMKEHAVTSFEVSRTKCIVLDS